MRRAKCCPPPAPAPLEYVPNCLARFVRACADGTGTIIEEVDGAYLWVKIEEDETYETAQERANEYALKLARYRALTQVLYCNSISPDDLAGCGLVEERPVTDFACANTICDQTGIPLCTEDGVNLITES